MNLSKKSSLVLLAITSLVFSRILFFFFHDPEGPNLLVVVGMAAILYVVSLMAHLFYPKKSVGSKLPVIILIQAILASIFYLLLR